MRALVGSRRAAPLVKVVVSSSDCRRRVFRLHSGKHRAGADITSKDVKADTFHAASLSCQDRVAIRTRAGRERFSTPKPVAGGLAVGTHQLAAANTSLRGLVGRNAIYRNVDAAERQPDRPREVGGAADGRQHANAAPKGGAQALIVR